MNAEDECLKAAVMKYGLNQWSRISSLLARKSAKQCKARWYEWLDPSIKKTEWTREEEEKLLHLAKIFPSQWRTISPIVGRTPAQCVEHYERLLDQAQGRDEIDENDPRKLRPGEIDPTPEIRPARADAVDMDDADKEMIAETRVRLRNIMGKKAKRRAREKFIEKTRQLAVLQKQRELRAAGIEYVIEKKRKKKRTEIDYNAEVPFERRPTEDAYQTGADEEPAPNPNIGTISINALEGERRDEEERRLRKLDMKKLKKLRAMNLPEHIEKVYKNNPLLYQKKSKLALSEPQLSDKDLEELGRLTRQAAELGKRTAEIGPTRELLGNYSVREPTPVRTPKYSSQLMREARQAFNLVNAPTPLTGGNAELLNEDFLGQEGRTKPAATPNPYKQIVQEHKSFSRGETPLSVHSKQTHALSLTGQSLHGLYQDELSLNNDEWADQGWEGQAGSSSSVNKADRIRAIIKKSLQSLPKPRDDYEIELPELKEFMRYERELTNSTGRAMDLEDIEDLKQQAKQQEELRDFYKQTQTRQRGLPIPSQVPDEYLSKLKLASSSSDLSSKKGASEELLFSLASNLVDKECAQLIVNDIVEKSDDIKASQYVQYYKKDAAQEFEVEDLERAAWLLEEEQKKILKEKGITLDALEEAYVHQFDNIKLEVPQAQKQADLPFLKSYARQLSEFVSNLDKEVQETLKIERVKQMQSESHHLMKLISNKTIELEAYQALEEQENEAMIHRLHEADSYLAKLQAKEAALQRAYRACQLEEEDLRQQRTDKNRSAQEQ